jgi:hypothetical protein
MFDVDSDFGAHLQSQESQEMLQRFNSYLTYMTFILFLSKTIDDPKDRKDLVEQIISQWGDSENKRIEDLKDELEDPVNKLMGSVLGNPMDTMVSARESALEETKNQIRFAFRKLTK